MLSDPEAESAFSEKMTNNTKVEEDGTQLEERQVDVHETADDAADQLMDFQSQEGRK